MGYERLGAVPAPPDAAPSAMHQTAIRFGTDGWRAVLGEDYTFPNVRRAAQGFARFVRRNWSWQRGIVVGYDRRFGAERFAETVACVLAGNNIRAYLVDQPCPTPVVAFSVADMGAAGAVMVTASHNPPSDNGLKVRTSSGAAVAPDGIARIEAEVMAVEPGAISTLDRSTAMRAGLLNIFNPDAPYLRHVRNLVDAPAMRRRALSVVFDPMYGSGAGWLPRILQGGRTRVHEIHADWNPRFPGLARPEPIPPQTDELCAAVRDAKADVGLAADGDGDRLGVVDENGRYVDQLRVIALLAYYFLEHRVDRRALVRTLTSTAMLDRLGRIYGVPVAETGVGMKFVAPRMRELNAAMGGEESGGYVFGPHMPERDGLVAALFFLDLMAREGKTPSQLVAMLFAKLGREYHYGRDDLTFDPGQRTVIEKRVTSWTPEAIDGTPVVRRGDSDGFKYYLADDSWLLIRFSGTEALLRVYCETTAADRVRTLLRIGREAVGLA